MSEKTAYQAALNNLARRVRKERQRDGLSQEGLAEKAGLDVRHVQKIEAGEVNLTVATLVRLAGAFSIRLKRLFE